MTEFYSASTITDLLRTTLVTLIDRPAYLLLCLIYQIFFNVASAELFSNATVKSFYYRIQLILGVFMVFKLAVSILQEIINPDKIQDKNNGMGKIISRVIISLVMLTVLTPIDIPNPQNDFERELNNNGLLFGTLYSLQTRILEDNTLGRLILGTTTTHASSTTKQGNRIAQSANLFASTILRGFVRINLVEEARRVSVPDGVAPETKNDNRACKTIPSEVLDKYTNVYTNPQEILSLVNLECSEADWGGFFGWIAGTAKKLVAGGTYVFAYIPLGGIVAFIFAFILLGYTVDIAVRAVKLAVLRIIAPIPIISNMIPSSGKDGGAFSNWVKALISTYIDIFVRLAVIYFVIFLIEDMIVNGIIINVSSGLVGVLSFIFICLGLFFFIRQAPKFIRDVLGIKQAGANNIGLSALLGGAAGLLGGQGFLGFATGAVEGVRAHDAAAAQGKAFSPGQAYTMQSDRMAEIRTGRKGARGGILGRMEDYLDYRAREGQASRYGIGSDEYAEADYRYKLLQSKAAAAQANVDIRRAEIDMATNLADKQAAMERYKAAIRENSNIQADLVKAQKELEKIEKDRSLLGLDADVESRRRGGGTYRSTRQVRTAPYHSPGPTDPATGQPIIDGGVDYAAAVDERGTFTRDANNFQHERDVKGPYDYNSKNDVID